MSASASARARCICVVGDEDARRTETKRAAREWWEKNHESVTTWEEWDEWFPLLMEGRSAWDDSSHTVRISDGANVDKTL